MSSGQTWHHVITRTKLIALESLGIKVVPKEQNPPCAPQLRPIEYFWAELKRRVYEGNWDAKNNQNLMKRIKKKLKSFDSSYFISLMSRVKTKIRITEDRRREALIK